VIGGVAAKLILFTAAAAISVILILLLRGFLRRHALSRPNARSSHREPTPQGGGIAVIAAALVTAMAFLLCGDKTAAMNLWPIFAATAFLACVGAWDDIRAIEVAPRLVLQLAAIIVVVMALPSGLRIVPSLPSGLEHALLVLGGLWFVNLFNFMDGIDWMTVAEVVPVTTGLVLLGMMGGLPDYGVVIALALGGATIGFAPFNRPIAKLFLGDVGSLPLGLLLGWLLVLVAGSGHLAAALLLPLYYLADATITLLQRLLRGEALWKAHRSHFYQRAVDNGFTVGQVVIRVIAVNVALVALACITALMRSLTADIVALALGAGIVGWLLISFEQGRRRA